MLLHDFLWSNATGCSETTPQLVLCEHCMGRGKLGEMQRTAGGSVHPPPQKSEDQAIQKGESGVRGKGGGGGLQIEVSGGSCKVSSRGAAAQPMPPALLVARGAGGWT